MLPHQQLISTLDKICYRHFRCAYRRLFKRRGDESVRRELSNFFGSVRSPVTAEQLEEWGFDQSFTNYEVVTTRNIGAARVSGLEYEYRQTLPWLPARLGHVLLGFNATTIHVQGASAGSISGRRAEAGSAVVADLLEPSSPGGPVAPS